jgi:hypothetical protein
MKPITRLKKELNEAQELLNDVNECISKGWRSYLGDPIYRYRRDVFKEVEGLKKEIRELSLLETKKTPRTIKL